MARPLASAPTFTTLQRGTSLSIRLSFRGVKYATPVLAKAVEANQLAKNGYVKNTHADYLTINETLAAATTRLENAAALALAAGEVTEAVIKANYLQLTKEAVEAVEAAEELSKAEAAAQARKLRLQADVRKIDEAFSLDYATEELAKLQRKVKSKEKEIVSIKKFIGVYEDDKLLTYLTKYNERGGEVMAIATTKRSFNAFIKTVEQYQPETRLQDVNAKWLADFVQWLLTTPIRKPVYSYKKLNGKLTATGIKRFDYLEPRQNSTVNDYLNKIKSCLNYYRLRTDELPEGVSISENYKLYKFEVQLDEDNAVALTTGEVNQLFKFRNFESRNDEKAIDILLFLAATSLRYSDLYKVNSTLIQNDTIKILAKKTRKKTIYAIIPLNHISRSLLAKYSGDMSNCKLQDYQVNECIEAVLHYKDGTLFPSLQTTVIKKQFRGTTEEEIVTTRAKCISTHSGRRTYITNALTAGMPIPALMQISGHTRVETLMKYVNKTNVQNTHAVNMYAES